MLDIQSIREDFPILSHTVYGKPLIYFDNAATTQKPRCVVEKIESGYYNVNANILLQCERQYPSGRAFLEFGGDGGARGGAAYGAAVFECPFGQRDCVYARDDRVD